MIHPDVSAWLGAIDAPSAAWRNALDAKYGALGMPPESRAMLRAALLRFRERFGDTSARVFRAPGRVNVRGMHVDTHGGFLNLMSHQREVMIVFSPAAPGRYELINADAAHADAAFETAALSAAARGKAWDAFLDTPEARGAISTRGQWWHYVLGAALRAEWAHGAPLFGLRACVAGNIPMGAALSSSAALCVAAYGAVCAMNGRENAPADWILAARDAEWFSGARTGTSDQAASVLCRPDEVCNVALLAEDFSLEGLRRVAFPGSLRLLVINSCTRRSLSGAEQIAYSKNRFAYSMAMDVFRQEWAALTGDDAGAAGLDRLSRINTDAPVVLARVYEVLQRVPSRVSLQELRERYWFASLDEQYNRYFGGAAEAERPEEFDLRGPLVYGIGESERARRFADWLERGDVDAAGRAMTTGHDGDRVRAANGQPYARAVTAEYLREARAAGTPISGLSGDYGASSPALDALVDAALAGGALGACLTGAGMAGCVIALCRAEDEVAVRGAVLERLRAADYPALARREAPLTEVELADAVVANLPPVGAGELPWPT